MMASKSSMVTSISGFGRLVPALLTRMLNGSALATAACMAARSVTSSTSVSACCPRARIACAASSISSRVRASKRHMRAGVRERGGGRQPDAAPGAGHQRALAVEAEGGSGVQLDHHSAACA